MLILRIQIAPLHITYSELNILVNYYTIYVNVYKLYIGYYYIAYFCLGQQSKTQEANDFSDVLQTFYKKVLSY